MIDRPCGADLSSPDAILVIQSLVLSPVCSNLIIRPCCVYFLSPGAILVIQSLFLGPLGPNLIDWPCGAVLFLFLFFLFLSPDAILVNQFLVPFGIT